jgi:hypothetical protein
MSAWKALKGITKVAPWSLRGPRSADMSVTTWAVLGRGVVG